MLWIILVAGISLYLILVVLLFLFQARLIYFPLQGYEVTPATIGLAYETIEFKTTDGLNLSGWFVPAEPARGVILFFHGNAGNISHRLDSIEIFHHLNLHVFIIDYRGYGQSEGDPTEQGTYLDAEAAWHYLVEERQIPPEKIILFGRSLGGAVAAWLAQEHSPGGLILESTFTSVPDLATQNYPFLPIRWLAQINYNTLAQLPKINCPVLIVHSQEDRLIPYSHSQQLFTAAREPKDFLQIKGGHNDGFMLSGQPYQAGLDHFITRYISNKSEK